LAKIVTAKGATIVDESISERGGRERAAYDDEDSFKYRNRRLHRCLAHVRQSPAAQRARRRLRDLVLAEGRHGPVLEIGCGVGSESAFLVTNGAVRVDALDVSEEMIATARAQHGADARLNFKLHDIHVGWEGAYRAIFGRAVLHHLDYRAILPRLFAENLVPGGVMAFLEPLGGNPLMRLYWRLTPQLHSADERPFLRQDIAWMERTLGPVEVMPIDLFQAPATVLSSWLFRRPNNVLTRAADRVDRAVTERLPAARFQARSGLIILRKPSCSA
jgi:SAM-dependent methyltransferase